MDGLGLHPAPSSRSPLSARAFGPEVLLGELIGRGGMSRVYRGWLRGTGVEVAVKILRDDLASHPDAVQRFVRERDLLAAVASPHVVRVHELVVHGDELGIVMDLVPGGHLRKAVAFPCPPAEAAELTVQIADGLAAVHAAGVVHRDLKPENVLVDADDAGDVLLRLTDFGISRLVDAGSLTQTTVTGTPGYLAPEVAAGGRVTAAADLYALGVVLYELCTGRGPFIADNPIVMILAHTRQAAPRPGGMPDGLWAVLSGLLAKDPTARPTADQVAATLRGILPELAGLPVCTPPPPLAPPSLSDGMPSDKEGGAPATIASRVTSLTSGAPPTAASPLGPSTGSTAPTGSPGSTPGAPGSAPDTGPTPALLGVAPPTIPPPLSRRDRHLPPPDPRHGDPTGNRAAPPRGPLRRPLLLAAAAAGGVVLLVLAGIGVIAALERQDSPVVSVTTDPPTPEPTGATASSAGENPPPPSPSDVGVITTIVASPDAGAGGRPAASKGSTSSSPKPTSPGTPTLARKDPTSEERHNSDGKVTLVLGGVSAGTGTIASITLSYDGRQQTVAVQPGTVASYEVPVGNLDVGKTYAFTAQVCNSAKLCTVTAAPFEFTPYGAAKVQAPSIKFAGQSLTITVPAVERNGNPNDPSCYLDLSATPADANAPQHRRVWFGGDSVAYDGKAATTYTATVTCETAGISDGSATSAAITTPAAPPPSPTASPPATPTSPAVPAAV